MKILIEDLTFTTILGVLPHERTTPQSVRIDCAIDYTYRDGGFINYADVVDRIIETMERERFELIETALNTIAATLKDDFPLIEELDLAIRKLDILPYCTVGVSNRFSFTR